MQSQYSTVLYTTLCIKIHNSNAALYRTYEILEYVRVLWAKHVHDAENPQLGGGGLRRQHDGHLVGSCHCVPLNPRPSLHVVGRTKRHCLAHANLIHHPSPIAYRPPATGHCPQRTGHCPQWTGSNQFPVSSPAQYTGKKAVSSSWE